MMISALLAMAVAAAPPPAQRPAFEPSAGATARGQAIVRLLSAVTVPMSAQSPLEAPQRVTTIRLADGDHAAFIVEFQ